MIRSASDSTLTGAGWPRLDGVTSNDSADGSRVSAYAAGDLAKKRFPLRGVKVPVLASWWWGNNAQLGDKVDVTFTHAVIGQVRVVSRVESVSWDIASPWVVLTLADTVAEGAF